MSLALNYLTAVGLNPTRDFGLLHVRKVLSYLTEHRWFKSGALLSCLTSYIEGHQISACVT